LSATGTPSPFRRRGFILAAAVVAVIILAAIVVAVTSLSRGSTNPTTAPTTPAPSASPSGDAGDESVCGLPGFETENTLTSAPETDWELVGTVAAPTDPTESGPGVVDDGGFRSCYAHTAEGALYAAANFAAMGSDATFSSRLVELVAPGPGRDRLASATTTSSSPTRAQIAGYSIGAYSSGAVTIDLVLNYADGRLVSIPLKLVWAEGDWKILLTDTGEFPLAPAEIENLGGYTPWAGA
jgi:hypothetical protein